MKWSCAPFFLLLVLASAFAAQGAPLQGAPLRGAPLQDLVSGKTVESRELLDQGKVLVFVEKDCAACSRQVNELKECRGLSQEAWVLISTDTPRVAKAEKLRQPERAAAYVIKSKSLFPEIRGTPTVVVKDHLALGLQSCEQILSRLQEGPWN